MNRVEDFGPVGPHKHVEVRKDSDGEGDLYCTDCRKVVGWITRHCWGRNQVEKCEK